MSNFNVKFRIGHMIGRLFERPRLKGTFRGRLVRFLIRYYYNNSSYLEYDGELQLIKRASQFFSEGGIVYDVGANRGQYARAWLDLHPSVRVVSFEVDPELFAALNSQADKYGDRWYVCDFGLSDKSGEVTIWKSERSDEITSLVEPLSDDFERNTAIVKDIGAVEAMLAAPPFFIKFDVEGHEFALVRRMISAGIRPKILQFEFGHTAVPSRVFLADFYAVLSEDYHIGRLYLSGVMFEKYDENTSEMMNVMGNYVAILRSEREIANALAV